MRSDSDHQRGEAAGQFQRVTEELVASPRTWVVTGAAGFIGSNLVEALLSLGQRVVGIDNFATGHRRNLSDATARGGGERFRFLELDVRDDAMFGACEEADFVLHQAALGSVPLSLDDPAATHAANVDGFVNTLIAARDAGVKRFVYASSSAVYGDLAGSPHRESNIGTALSPYAVSKRIDELYAGVFQSCYGLEVIGLRYFNVFGRRQDPAGAYAAVIPRWVSLLLRGEPCVLYGDGETTRDFCHVENVVRANILAATAPAEATNSVYNIACGAPTTLVELYRLLREHLGTHRPQTRDAVLEHEDFRAGDIRHSVADIDSARRYLHYEVCCRVPEGIERTLEWYIATLS